MAAFVAALLAQVTGRTAWLSAILASRFTSPLPLILGTALALALGNAVAAAGGAVIGARLSPNARDLLLAFALLAAGVAAVWPLHVPDRLERWRTGPFLTSLFGVSILAAGDSTQFLTLAIAGRGTSPALAAVGATLGALAVNIAAILGGEEARRSLPMTAIRTTIGGVFLVGGAALAVSALRLV